MPPSRCLSLLLCGALFSSLPAVAGVLVPREPGGVPLSVRKQRLRVEVKDQVMRATLDEVFENHTDHPVEAEYLVPLPEDAAVFGFATWVDGRRVESRVEEKRQAEKTYRDAQRQAQSPAILEKVQPGTFRTRVDGIPAHGTKRIEVSYAQILPYDAGLVTLRLPLETTGHAGAQAVREFRLSVDVSDQKRVSALEVRSHPALVERTGPGSFRVTLEGNQLAPGKALLLTYRTESSRMGLSFVPYRPRGEADGYFLLLASPQELTTEADIVQKDVVFVFDTSGSMAGEKMEQAREALRRCLSALNREDRFGIVAFSDSMNPFRSQLLLATEENVQGGLAFANALSAGGGTNLSGALLQGLKLFPAESARPRAVVFLTDGIPSAGVTDEALLAKLVREQNAQGARLFPFGVGTDVNRTFLEQLARENRGGHDFVEPGQSIEAVVGGFYAKISKPVLSDLAFDFGEVTVSMQYPDILPDLYKGSQLVLVGRYRGSGKVKASLSGNLNGARRVMPFGAHFPEAEEENAFVARIWAQKRIDFLISQARLHGQSEELRQEVIALAERFQVLTPYTSLVAVRPAAVAQVYPQRVKPGDPTIRVRAPKDAHRVAVTLPFGEVKRAFWEEAAQAWVVRFLVPPHTEDGTYPISVRVEHADGRQEVLALEVSIDTRAPAFAAAVGPVRPGALLSLRAQAVVSPLEVLATLVTRRDRAVALKSLFDIRSVSARLWDGREVPLTLQHGGLAFRAEAETNGSLAPGRYPIVLTARDFAGNVARLETSVEVLP